MNDPKWLKRLKEVLENLPLIPGLTWDSGEIVVRLELSQGSARRVDVSKIDSEVEELNGVTLRILKKRKVIIANSATLT